MVVRKTFLATGTVAFPPFVRSFFLGRQTAKDQRALEALRVGALKFG